MAKYRITILLLVLFVGTIPTITVAQSEVDCNPIQGAEICIMDTEISESTVTNGDTITLTIQLVNKGNETGDAVILMGTQQPEGGYSYSVLTEVTNLKSGESKELSLTIPVENTGRPGVHAINFLAFDGGQEHLYDATGFSSTVVIQDDSIDVIKWLQGLHYTIQISLVLVPVLLVVIGWLIRG